MFGHTVTMARSKNCYGPGELHPDNYAITARHSPGIALQRAGHGVLVDTKDSETDLVFLGGCPLGRETAIHKMKRGADGWQRKADGTGVPSLEVPAPELPAHLFPKAPLH
jgi:xylan 1,4-beta-xylosidase